VAVFNNEGPHEALDT